MTSFRIAAELIEIQLRGMRRAEQFLSNPNSGSWVREVDPDTFLAQCKSNLLKLKEELLQIGLYNLTEWGQFHRKMGKLCLQYPLCSPEYRRDEHPALAISEEVWKHMWKQRSGLKIQQSPKENKIKQQAASVAA